MVKKRCPVRARRAPSALTLPLSHCPLLFPRRDESRGRVSKTVLGWAEAWIPYPELDRTSRSKQEAARVPQPPLHKHSHGPKRPGKTAVQHLPRAQTRPRLCKHT